MHSLLSYLLIIIVPVTSVTLLPTMMTRNEGQQINLTCETSNCNPRATINWYKSSEDITNQTTFLTRSVEGLQRTISILLSTAVKDDNGKHVFCIASNSPTLNFTSNAVTLNVLCKYSELITEVYLKSICLQYVLGFRLNCLKLKLRVTTSILILLFYTITETLVNSYKIHPQNTAFL